MRNTSSNPSSAKRFYGGLWAVIFACLMPAMIQAQTGFETMDQKTLVAQADLLKDRLNKNPADYEVLRSLGTAYHYLALKDSGAYAKKAVQTLESAYGKNQEDYQVLCYLGDAYLLLAKDGGDGMSRAANATKGLEYMDKAVRKAPDDITIRLTRGYSAKASPRSLNRRPIAYDDFEHVVMLFEKGLKAPMPLKAPVYRSLSGLYQEDGDKVKALKYLEMAEKCEKGA